MKIANIKINNAVLFIASFPSNLSLTVDAQKCPVARKDLGFEPRRTIMYVEAQILSPDAANGHFSASTIH